VILHQKHEARPGASLPRDNPGRARFNHGGKV
jgi:hypothetical protein